MKFVGMHAYLVVSALLFVIGVMGVFLNRRNLISILMAIELILLSVNLNFITFSIHLKDMIGQIFSLFILTVSAAEIAIGLAILVGYFRQRSTINVDDMHFIHEEDIHVTS